MFAKLKDESYIVAIKENYYDAEYKELTPGVYNTHNIGGMFEFRPAFTIQEPLTGLIHFKDGITKQICSHVKSFFSKNTIDKYKEMKLTHKMGIILYGPPGTGKTSSAFMAMEQLVLEHKAICLIVTGKGISEVMHFIRIIRLNQTNPILVFFDEIDNSIKAQEGSFLTFLDGDHTIDNLITFGCTNYLDKIPERIKDRKSRIKHTILVDRFPIKVYEEYIIEKLPNLDVKLRSEIAFKAEEAKLTIDQLKHVLIDYYIEGISINDAIGIKDNSNVIKIPLELTPTSEDTEEDDDLPL